MPDSNVFELISEKKQSKILHLQLFTGKTNRMEKQEGFFARGSIKSFVKMGINHKALLF